MCGRYAIAMTLEEAEKEFGIKKINQTFIPKYNVAPTDMVPAIYKENGELVLDSFRWGLIPSFAVDEKIGARMINSRVESVAEKPSFAESFQRQRVLIPATGFFEWKKEGKEKIPFYIRIHGRKMFAFAGISATWRSADKTIKSFSILTTDADIAIKGVHDRMPLILPKSKEHEWLDETDTSRLLKIQPDNRLEMHQVSQVVNSVKNNSPECVAKIA